MVNRGTISGAYAFFESLFAAGETKLTNSGEIIGELYGVQFDSGGTHKVVNSGKISGGLAAISCSNGDLKVTNTGTIIGNVWPASLAGHSNKLVNAGMIDGSVDFGDGDDVFTNFLVVGGKTKSGIVTGFMDLGFGDDRFNGGNNAETVFTGSDDDIVKLGGGNDKFETGVSISGGGFDGNDTVDGGAGIDTYDARSSTPPSEVTAVVINLDVVFHSFNGAGFGSGGISGGFASGPFVGVDKVTNFENAIGTFGRDVILGSSAANFLDGNSGADLLCGFGGNDRLIGDSEDDLLRGGVGDDRLNGGSENDFLLAGKGKDVLFGDAGIDNLYGGPGKDRLTGGSGPDTFSLGAISESGVGATERDIITDFQSDEDVINLHDIDANPGNGGSPPFNDDAFDVINSNGGLGPFTHHAGELRYKYSGNSTIVEGDVNGDAIADFQIELIGHFALTDSDFVL